MVLEVVCRNTGALAWRLGVFIHNICFLLSVSGSGAGHVYSLTTLLRLVVGFVEPDKAKTKC